MTWARGQYRQGKHGPVYLREFDEASSVPALLVAGAFMSVILALIVIVASDRITVAGEHETTLVIIGVPMVAALLVLAIYTLQRRTDRLRLIRSAYEVCSDDEPKAAQLTELARLREGAGSLSEDVLDQLERAYGQLIHLIVADGVAEEHELLRLERTEAALQLPADRIEHGRLQGFLDVFDRAMEDGVLTDEEQASIAHIREALEIPDRLIRRELAFARRLVRAHEIRTEELRPIRVGVRLGSTEQAFYTTMATEKKRVVRTHPQGRGGRREFAFESLRSGNLFVTDERLLFDAGALSSIPLARILDVGVEARSKLLMIHEHGRKTSHYFDVPAPYMTMVHIERMLEMAAPARRSSAGASAEADGGGTAR